MIVYGLAGVKGAENEPIQRAVLDAVVYQGRGGEQGADLVCDGKVTREWKRLKPGCKGIPGQMCAQRSASKEAETDCVVTHKFRKGIRREHEAEVELVF